MSAAYYAVFHFLVDEATRELLPQQTKALRHVVARTFVHTEMAEASKGFSKAYTKGISELHDSLRACIPSNVIEASVGSMCAAFADLQEARHKADYDLSRKLRRHEVLALVRQAQDSISSWRASSAHPSKQTYLVSLLLWKRMKRD